MSVAASSDYPTGGALMLSRRQAAFDVLLAAVCLAITLAINLSGSQSVSANRDPDVLTVALTVLAVASIALRRRLPFTILAVTLAGVLGLVLVRGTVGSATIGPFIAAYAAVAYSNTRNSRRAIGLVILALATTAVLDPVDLSGEGAVLSSLAFAGVILFASSTRSRWEAAEADVRSAEQRVELERERANSERERASLSATTERLRITRELHDVIGHAMSVMVVQAGAAGRLLDTADPARARTAVSDIESTGRLAMADMRNLLGVLRDGGTEGAAEGDGSPRAPAPTLDDVSDLVTRVGQSGLPTTLTEHGTPLVVTPGEGLAAYRIVQEALTNCLKHSAATCASVDVTYCATEVQILVTDDGTGPAHRSLERSAGQGVAGMRERVAAYGGDLTIDQPPEGGFRVRATLPLAVTR